MSATSTRSAISPDDISLCGAVSSPRTALEIGFRGTVIIGGSGILSEAETLMVRSLEVLNELTFPTLRETNPVLTERLRRSRALRTGTLTESEVYARHPERPANVSGQSRQTQIMISYCHRDATFARKLMFGGLEQAFAEHVWIDSRRIASGDSFVSAINYALLNATNFVLLYSREASISKWVINETNAAIVRRNQLGLLRIHPVLLDDAPLPPLLAKFHAIDSRSMQFERPRSHACVRYSEPQQRR